LPTLALTNASVQRTKPPRKGQADHFDRGYPGLALRISYGGARTWVYFYRLHGKQRRLTLGRWPALSLAEARDEWRAARKTVGKGENPAHRKPAAADSFAAVADQWLQRDQAHNRSVAEVRRIIERDAKPAWVGRQINIITRRDVNDLVDAVADRGAVTMARRLDAHLHRLFRWSVGRGIIEANPMADLPKPGNIIRRDRVLTDAELIAVWKAASGLGWPFGPIIQLLILTGARREEIRALRWSEIKGDKVELAGTRTKSGEGRTIPLAVTAAKLINGLPHIGNSDYVFTTNGRTPVSGFSKIKTRLDATVKIAPWRIHDIRRSCATGLQRLGVGLQVIEAIWPVRAPVSSAFINDIRLRTRHAPRSRHGRAKSSAWQPANKRKWFQ
jgi:integrase